MSAFKPLLDAALAGTQRKTVPQLAATQPLAELLEHLRAGQSSASHQLLQMAGALDLCEQAGYRPAHLQPACWPAACKVDSLPELDERLADIFALLLDQGPERLQHEACTTLSRIGQRIPARLLPAALEAGRRSLVLRPALISALGERGLWLAGFNEAWKYAAGASSNASVETQWNHGTLEQRRALLTRLRAEDAAAARQRLEAELDQMPAKERAEFIPLLATGLGPDDESLLDALLKDRSKDVRQAAAHLLASLPQSRHARFICAQLDGLIQQQSGFLRSRLTIDAPAQADPLWKGEAVEATRPAHESLGERAWWLYQLVRQAPLSWWVERCGMAPEALLKWAGDTEWKEALLRGWRDAVLACGDAQWCAALLGAWDIKLLGRTAGDVLAMLPIEQRETYWAQDLARGGKGVLGEVLGHMLSAFPLGQTLSKNLSQQIAPLVSAQLAADSVGNDYSLRYQLPDALCLLHPAALGALMPLPGTPTTPSLTEFYQRLETIVRCRQALAALASTPSTGTSS